VTSISLAPREAWRAGTLIKNPKLHPLEDLDVPSLGCRNDSLRAVRAPVFHDPLERLEVPAFCGIGKGTLVPRATFFSTPLQNFYVASSCCTGTGSFTPNIAAQASKSLYPLMAA
jgi:hypothetical protein